MRDEYWRVIPRLRSNILERVADQPPSGCRKVVIYAWKTHRDLDEHLLAQMPHAVTVCRTRLVPLVLRLLLRDQPRVLELPEPMWYRYWPSAWLVAAASRLRRGKRPLVVSVAMENLPARRGLTLRQVRAPRPLARVADPLLRSIWIRSLGAWDALFFMSDQAEANYRDIAADAIGAAVVMTELELVPRCSCCDLPPPEDRRKTVLFAAQFLPRKGIDLLMEAWPQAAEATRGWTLRLLGFGPLEPDVLRWAAGRDDVTVEVAPTRAQLHAAMRSAAVLVLPSREVRWWREQIGYPILEALSHGCTIVTTEDTGLAGWLRDHGHAVVEAGSVAALADALRRVCTAARRPSVLPDLPAEDTRHVAERWFVAVAPS